MFSVAKNSFTINAWYHDNKCCCSEGSRCAGVLGGRARSFFLNIRVPERKTTSNLTWKENILRPSKMSKRLWSQNWFDTFYVLDCLRKRIACVHLVSIKIFFLESFSLLLRQTLYSIHSYTIQTFKKRPKDVPKTFPGHLSNKIYCMHTSILN